MKASKTENRYETDFQKPKSGLQKTVLTSLVCPVSRKWEKIRSKLISSIVIIKIYNFIKDYNFIIRL